MAVYQTIEDYFWIIAILFGFINYLYGRNYVKPLLTKHPELESEASQVLLYYLFFLTIPFGFFGIEKFIYYIGDSQFHNTFDVK